MKEDSPEPKRPDPPLDPRRPGQDAIAALPQRMKGFTKSGLASWTPAERQALLDAAALLRIPVDSIAAVMASESGFTPEARNPGGASGLIQITTAANLPGFTTQAAIDTVLSMGVAEQINDIVIPYYSRMGAKARGASAGRLFMLNFMPDRVDKPDDFVLGRKLPDAEAARLKASEKAKTLTPEEKAALFAHRVYIENPGLDPAKKGTILVGDVKAHANGVLASAKGKRMRVDGSVYMPMA